MATFLRFLISTLLTSGLLLTSAQGPASAGKSNPLKKTTTYLVSLQVDGRTVAGPFSSTETVTAEFVARPTTTGNDPTQWSGEATLNFGPITNTGLPAGCTLTNTPPTGTMKIAITKSGDSVNVVWSSSVNQLGGGTAMCMGQPVPFAAPAVEPMAFLNPMDFNVPATGGSQKLLGKLDAGEGMMENIGTLTITRRTECGQKVKEVNTYPPGQQTSASSRIGKGFAPGEKVTADVNVEFVLEDGSVLRLAKGTSFAETPACDATSDTSKDYKGTLLLGKVWFHIQTALGGDPYYEIPRERCVTGRRGTTFWTIPKKRFTTLSVSEGSMWVAHRKSNGQIGKKTIVKKGHTAILTKKSITVRELKPKDAFPFGGK